MTAAAGNIGGGRFIRAVTVSAPDEGGEEYPFDLPVVQFLLRSGGLALAPGVTFLTGENGSGKSTLVEAVAVAAGINAEGGSQNYRFVTRSSESSLGAYLTPSWGHRKPRSRFFLRSETYYNVKTEIERLGPEQIALMGGIIPHERSHGESFLDLLVHRFSPSGLYLLDEPEAALSFQGCLAVLHRFSELVAHGCQLLISTHSPILLSLPGATIYEIADDGAIAEVSYDDARAVQTTRHFLANPQAYLRYLTM
ncbi:AAA family ATPase [Mycolicibacterium bacteremicum]|uniref:AAA family ATPase n=1 Tax=Mycolicibacterium bacteremicum TaxID=564198 RepID=UPI0026EFF60E|nr:AAA family ATPase [Mycolicibacterium bacteremicum]